MVFQALTEALIFGFDASRDGDETGTRWAASAPVGMGCWLAKLLVLSQTYGLDLSQSDKYAQVESWASLGISR